MSQSFNLALADNKNPYWLWGPLAFSIFYFLPIIFNFEKFSWLKLVGVAVIYLTFLVLYKKALFAKGESALLPVISMVLLCVVGTFVTPGTQALFGYASYFSGFNFRFNKAIQGLVGIILAIVLAAHVFHYINVYFLAPAIIVTIGLFFFGQAERKDRIHKQKESISQQKIEQFAAIAERERIARDLHDLVGHSLSSIALKANLAEKLIDKHHYDKASTEIHQVAALSRDILSQVREAVSGIKKYNLEAQLDKLIKELINQGFNVEHNVNVSDIPKQLELPLQLIATELVTNILRHSKGNSVCIDLNNDHELLTLTIKNNGHTKNPVWGNGLTGIKERCAEINAHFNTETNDGFCATITLEHNT